MKKIARAVSVVAVLVYFLVHLCSAQPSPQHTGKRSRLIVVLSEAASAVRPKTTVPLRLPTDIVWLNNASKHDLYAIVQSADDTGYTVILGALPNCEGAHQCSYGTLIGTTRPLSELDRYRIVGREGMSPARLANGIDAQTYYDHECGAYCADSLIVWSEGKFNYVIGLKGAKKSNLIRAANSAIQAGQRK